jgi:hypothetical protein
MGVHSEGGVGKEVGQQAEQEAEAAREMTGARDGERPGLGHCCSFARHQAKARVNGKMHVHARHASSKLLQRLEQVQRLKQVS